MGLLNAFYPNEWVGSVSEIPFEQWYEKGYRGLTFDIDNTLVPHGAPATHEVILLFRRLHRIGFETCLISNNRKERVLPFAKAVDSAYVCKASKPARRGFLQACLRMGTSRSETIFIGDQLFTDIWGARRAGLYSVLVQPIDPKEEIQIVLKRFLEYPILKAYAKSRGIPMKKGFQNRR